MIQIMGGIMPSKPSGKPGRNERDAGTGKWVPGGTEKKYPKTTVTEPRKKGGK
jgi:hypothetical protein